jgi:hypothetical protein
MMTVLSSLPGVTSVVDVFLFEGILEAAGTAGGIMFFTGLSIVVIVNPSLVVLVGTGWYSIDDDEVALSRSGSLYLLIPTKPITRTMNAAKAWVVSFTFS